MFMHTLLWHMWKVKVKHILVIYIYMYKEKLLIYIYKILFFLRYLKIIKIDKMSLFFIIIII